MTGHQVLLDFCGIPYDFCVNDKEIARVLSKVASRIGADILSLNRYRFTQPAEDGCTVVLTLDASHLSAHSYAQVGLLAIDAFISGKKERAEKCAKQIINELGLEQYLACHQIVERFKSNVPVSKIEVVNS